MSSRVELFCRSLLRGWSGDRTSKDTSLAIDAIELEPRVFYDAAPLSVDLADAGIVGELNDQYVLTHDTAEPFQLLDAIEAELSQLLVTAPLAEPHSSDMPQDWNESITLSPDLLLEATPQRRELIVVDGSIAELDHLLMAWQNLEQTDRELTLLTLQPGENGLSTISRQLAESEFRFDAIHLFTDGREGAIQLGDLWLDQHNLDQQAGELLQWRSGLTEQADLQLYGCYVADGQDAQQWLTNLSGLLQVDLEASTDLTGSASRGGDWELEFSLGQIESSRILTAESGGELNLLLATGTDDAELIVGTTGTDTHTGLAGDDLILGIDFNSLSLGQLRSNNVVLIDQQLEDFDALIGAIREEALVFVYDSLVQSAADILGQVGNWASNSNSQINSLSILSHGVDGAFQLGSTWIDASGLELLHDAWTLVSKSFRDDAYIYLLSCDVAGSAVGRELVDSLAEMTSVQVFASDDITGQGGDWILEYASKRGLSESSQRVESIFEMEELYSADVSLAWYGASWQYRQSVTISSALLDGTVDASNYVILVDITQSALKSAANGGRVGQADGGDFVFTLSDELTKLSHQIESYDPVTGRIKAWVEVPTLSALSNTSLFLYYGNATAANQWDNTGTWNTTYGGVWHLSNGLLTDSTSNANNGSNSGSTDTAGIIEEGRAFNGSSQSITVADSNSLDETNLITISAWIFPTINDSQWRTIVSKGTDGSMNYWFGIRQSQLEFWMVGTGYDSNVNLTLNTWSHVTATFNNATNSLQMYVNGSEIYSTTSASVSPAANTQPFLIGNSSLNEWWQGSLDEVRFRKSITSANEILADYRSQVNPSAYVSLSSEEGPPVITSNGGGATASISISENSTAVTTVSAADPGTPVQTLTYSISGGADAAKFAISSSTGVLTFVSAPDFESPTDSGANNVYDVIVVASDGELSDAQTIAITVTNTNDAPTITNGYTHSLTGTNEDTTSSGTLASAILTGANWADVDSGAVSGLAITAVTGSGTWQYSTDGATWANFGAVSGTNALLITSTTRVRYIPNGQNGETATFTYKAWDRTSGTASTNATPSYATTASSGGTTAFSSNNASAQIVVSSVNDAPTITNGYTHSLTGTNEDTTSSGTLASAILTGASWADVDSGAVSGLAITAVTGSGTWQYSTDGATWANFGAVSGTNALLITSSTQVRYLPNGQNGETATFTYKAWDQTSGTASTNATPSYATTASSGGTTAFSTNNASAQITVTSVNDAPTITNGHSFSLTGTNEDTTSSGTLASAILTGASRADVDSGAISGLAITAVTGSGTWQYSTDGTTWANFGAVSGTNALLITSSTQVRYVPNGQNGETANFTYKAWDQTSGTASTNATPSYATTASSGGTTTFSSNNASAQIVVTSVNDAPTITSGYTHTLAGTNEDTTSSATLASAILTGANWADVDSGAFSGMAITAVTGSGTWQYSSDGTTWANFGAVSGTNALLITASTQVRYLPNGQNGETATFSYKAWDQNSGTASTNATPSYASTASSGGTMAFSTNNASAQITVTSVNDAPVFSTSSGSSGFQLISFGAGLNDEAGRVARQSDGKLVVLGITNGDFGVVRINSDGTVDSSFGSGGKVSIDGGGTDSGKSIRILSDGRILVAGRSSNGSNNDFSLVILNSNGTLDTNFSGDGKLLVPVGTVDNAHDAVVQSDGKIIIIGEVDGDFGVIRLNTDGSLDTTFSGDGKLTQSFGNSDGALAVALQTDGKIVVTGWTANGETGVIRLNTDGSLDTTFGTNGLFAQGVSGYDQGVSLAIQSDGKIVVGGHGNAGSGSGFFLMRLNANGTLDTSFSPGGSDGDGMLVTYVATNPEYGSSLALQSDGKILMTGVSNGTFAVLRVNSDGSNDSTFGTAGKVSLDVGGGYDESKQVFVQPDGKIIVVGYSVNTATDSSNDFSIVRLNANGSLDTTFNGVSGNGLGASISFTENNTAVVLAGLVQISDTELTAANNFSGATLTLVRNGGANSQDLFSATGTLGALAQGGNLTVGGTVIGTVTTNSGGTLVLTLGSNATNSLVNLAMQQIAYANSSEAPPANVQIDWTFSDGNSGAQGTGGSLSATGSVTVNITAVNDAPTITSGYTHTLAGTNEDTTSSGTLASAILTGANWADVDSGAFSGLAITDVTGNGTWQYSTDGATWGNFGAVSSTNALLITSSTQVRYVPNGQNGETATFSYKAWDQTSGTASTNATPSYATTASSGGTTAFSTNNASAQITVTSVNDAPVAASDLATAVEAGGLNNATAGTNPSGNVLTNDTDPDSGDSKTVAGVAAGSVASASGNVGSQVTGSYGSISIAADGSYSYTLDNGNPVVQTLRTNSDTLTDTFTYTVQDAAGLTSTTQITVTIQGANDAPADLAGTLTVGENTPIGNAAGTITASDIDSGDTLSYSLIENASGRFAINSSTGVVTVADGSLLNFEAATSHNISVRITDAAGATYDEIFTVIINDVDEFDVTPVVDNNPAANSLNENSANGTLVGITGSASDADGATNTITYSLDDSAGGRFAVDSSSGVVTVADSSLLNYEAATSHSITLRATSADGSFSTQSITINLTDVDEFDVTPVTDTNPAANSLNENSANGALVGITGSASDADGATNTITYSLDDSAGGRFTVDSSSGVVTVADSSLLNYEAATSHSITLRATSTDGSFSTQSFTINLTDVDEFDVTPVVDSNPAANSLDENSANGTLVGITGSASDADGTTNAITYSLDDSAGGRFSVDSSTGVVTVADSSLLNYEAATSHSITLRATSADGSFSTQSFTINLTDVDEFDVSPVVDSNPAANTLDENSANGTQVGITASASDADGATNTITYSLDDSAGGRFAVDSSSGVVTVADSSLLNYEAATSHSITIRATSSDGSFSTQSFTINLTDVDEFDVTPVTDANAAANTLDENSANGTLVGITASASDADGATNAITYSLDDSAGGRFAVDSSTGVVTVADSSLLNYEAATSHSITLRATSADGSFSTQSFTINLTDVDEFDVTPVVDINPAANTLDENSANGTQVGITASASDADSTTNAITYSLDDSAGGRFTVDSSTGVVTVADSSLLNYEAATSHSITLRATSADGSFSTQSFTINLTDVDEFDVSPVVDSNPAANTLDENSANGTQVGITASSSDADGTTNAITYSLDDSSGGRFAVDSSTGVVTVADSSLLNYEAATSHSITLRATSADGSFSTQSFTINLTDVDEFDVTPVTDANPAANTLDENSANGTQVGITASASDADGTTNAITYSLDDSAGGRFSVDSSTGVVTVADSSLLNYEAATSHSITIRATSSDGSFSTLSFTINLTDVDEFDVSPVVDSNPAANTLDENSANGTQVGITASASDADGATNAITYSLDDSAGGRFAVDSSTGVVTVADSSLLNYEAATSHSITLRATSADGSFSTQSFTINLTDVDEFDVSPVVDSNPAANTLDENSANGTQVGITASASDADGATNAITCSLDDSAGGRFAVDSSTGVVTVADSSLLNYEAATSHSITLRATSSDGSFSTQSFTINLTDVDEFDVTPVVDSNPAANTLDENSANGTQVGITASASDVDGTTNVITYSLDDSSGGRFSVDSSTGVVTVADSSLLNYEAATSHSITLRATSADGSFSTQSFTINLTDVDEFDVTPVTDANPAANTLDENSANGTLVGITGSASDADGATNAITYSLDDNAGGRFAVDSSSGVVTVADSSLLNYEAATSHSITLRATSADGSFSTQGFIINLTDVDEFDVTPVVDSDLTANLVDENAATGTYVGITASASDADGTTNAITYSLDDSAGGRFAIDNLTGVVTVADGSKLNCEAAAAHDIVVQATSSDGSFAKTNYTIQINDLDEFDASPLVDPNPQPNSVAENQAAGTTVGLTAWSSDSDATINQISYSLTDDDAGRFSIDISTGTVQTTRSLDREADGGSRQVIVRATSADGSFVEKAFVIDLEDEDEFNATQPSDSDPADNRVSEIALAGSTVGLTGQSVDGDATNNAVVFSLIDDGDGRFGIDASTGAVTTTRSLDREFDGPDFQVTIRATSADGSYADQTFTILLDDVDEFDATVPLDDDPAANSAVENASAGTLVGLVGHSFDADATNNTVSYSLIDDDDGRFAIDASTGAVTTTRPLDREIDGGSRQVTIRATSTDGSFADEIFLVALEDINEASVSIPVDLETTANQVVEGAAIGSSVGVSAWATDSDATQSQISYQLVEDAGGRFAIDASTGLVTVAGPLDYESAVQHSLVIRATSTDGSDSQLTVSINVLPLNDNTPYLASPPSYTVGEHSLEIGILTGSDLDLPIQNLSYSISGGPDATHFTLNSATGLLRFAALQNYEAPADADSNGIYQVQVRIFDGTLWSEQQIEVTVLNENDLPIANQDAWSFDEDMPIMQSVLDNDFDEDEDALSVTLLDGPAQASSFSLNPDGTFLYLPKANYYGSDSFVYGLSDGRGGFVEGVVTLTISPVNDAPISLSNAFTVLQGATLESVTGVLINDSDVENDPLVAILVSPPNSGRLVFQSDGSFIYFPDRGFIGIDSFTYIASDSFNTSPPTMVKVVVNPSGSPPPSGSGNSGTFSNTSSGNEANQSSNSDSLDSNDSGNNSELLTGQASLATGNPFAADNTTPWLLTNFVPPAVGSGSTQDNPAEPPILAIPTESKDLESQLLAEANRVRNLIVAYHLDSEGEDVVTTKIRLADRVIEIKLSRRNFWEQLAFLKDQLNNSSNSDSNTNPDDASIELGTVTMAASLSYIIWLLRGSAMMATLVTQVPAWKMIDPLVILDSLNGQGRGQTQEDETVGSYFGS